ncbi:11316_t:CDS:1 [Racocetra persica]|uniref:11316_t:CDS:1 n=1 Tax=Racocetra persica TaxID=160502 RepID=A0ACA9NHL0_9GLOM|nr:11316_t:CDS:1 [Racocetra persica]
MLVAVYMGGDGRSKCCSDSLCTGCFSGNFHPNVPASPPPASNNSNLQTPNPKPVYSVLTQISTNYQQICASLALGLVGVTRCANFIAGFANPLTVVKCDCEINLKNYSPLALGECIINCIGC